MVRVLSLTEEDTETTYRMVLEHEGKEFTWVAITSLHNSSVDWYDKDWKLIDQPDWADDLDMWEIYNNNEGKIEGDN
jgi:hypothetical protein